MFVYCVLLYNCVFFLGIEQNNNHSSRFSLRWSSESGQGEVLTFPVYDRKETC